MDYQTKLIYKWLEIDQFTEKEKYLIDQECPEDEKIYDDDKFKQLTKDYLNLLPFSNISEKTHKISFFKTATMAIDKLFETYIDDNTLVVVSNIEHPSCTNNVDKCKNVYILNRDTEIIKNNFHDLLKECRKYKKIFVYIIGTERATGIITPQLFFETFKEWLILNKKEHIMILDDVHGMFMVPRDYSLFDYVIYTCHAMLKNFDMGFLISHNNSPVFGEQIYNWGKSYIDGLNTVFKHRQKLYSFKYILAEYFSKYIADNKMILHPNTAPHIFSPQILNFNKHFNKEDIEELNKEMCKHKAEFEVSYDKEIKTYIRFREGWYITYPDALLPCLEMVKNILDLI